MWPRPHPSCDPLRPAPYQQTSSTLAHNCRVSGFISSFQSFCAILSCIFPGVKVKGYYECWSGSTVATVYKNSTWFRRFRDQFHRFEIKGPRLYEKLGGLCRLRSLTPPSSSFSVVPWPYPCDPRHEHLHHHHHHHHRQHTWSTSTYPCHLKELVNHFHRCWELDGKVKS